MKTKTIIFTVSFLASITSSPLATAENTEILIKDALTTIHQKKPSIPKLRKAAETGDKEAQFYLAETLTGKAGHLTPEAHLWYVKSAKQGDIYAMFRLSRQDQDICKIMDNCPSDSIPPETWGAHLLKAAHKRAQEGDGEGMEMLYTITGDLNWLVKSAAAGYPSAQWWLAKRYGDGDGWFFFPGQRENEIKRLYEASAENGYPPSISEYAGILLLDGDIEKAQQWLLKGVATGYAAAVGTYAYSLEHGKYYHFKKDLELAYALNLVLSELGGGKHETSEYALENLKPKLTSEQIATATQQAKDWKATHPAVSYYPPKLEFY